VSDTESPLGGSALVAGIASLLFGLGALLALALSAANWLDLFSVSLPGGPLLAVVFALCWLASGMAAGVFSTRS